MNHMLSLDDGEEMICSDDPFDIPSIIPVTSKTQKGIMAELIREHVRNVLHATVALDRENRFPRELASTTT